jgi:hypothetical protein
VHYVLKALPHESLSYCIISLGNGTYILAYRVAKGTLVGRGYILNRREDCKEKVTRKKGERHCETCI